jgi:UDP-2,4-diacetamido-2,4,6-trideoxy-beta-L-altropyranose hydrolase
MSSARPLDGPTVVSSRQVYFRVDADTRIGSGHLVRCRLLAAALQQHGVASAFLTMSMPDVLIESVAVAGHEVVRVSDADALDAGRLSDAIRRGGHTRPMLVVDSNLQEFHETEWHASVRSRGIRLMIITFRHDCHFSADLVLNQNLLALQQQYSAEPHTELLLGPRFAVLARQFRDLHEKPLRSFERPSTVLLTFGGADRRDLTLRAVRALARLRVPPERLLVIAGAMYERLPKLRALLSEHPEMRPELHVDTVRMPELMGESQLAVSCGGLTLWELACAGVPNVVVSSSDPERRTAQSLARAGLACYVGHHDEVTETALTDAIECLSSDSERLRSLALEGRKHVDGRGLDRVTERMLGHLGRRA